MKNRYRWLLSIFIIVGLLASSCATAPPKNIESSVTQSVTTGTISGGDNKTGTKQPGGESSPPVQPSVNQPPVAISQAPQSSAPASSPAAIPQTPQPSEPKPIPPEPAVPAHKYQELALFALDLINKDRIANGLDPVAMGGNTASQTHAEENLANDYSSHWDMNGFKPYMRYTLAGGVNFLRENVLGTGTSDGPIVKRDPKEMIAQAEQQFMESPLHRATILYEWDKKVSLGIAYNDSSLSFVQDFEGDYIGFSDVPSIAGTILSMAGKLKTGTFAGIAINYDPLPQPLSPQQLNSPPYDSSYNPGEPIGNIIAPPPPGAYYTNLYPSDVVGTTWDTRSEGWFTIKADISKILTKGNGVYTIAIEANINGEFVQVSNYSVFLK